VRRAAVPGIVLLGGLALVVQLRTRPLALVVLLLLVTVACGTWRSLERWRTRYARLALLSHSLEALAAAVGTDDVLPLLAERATRLVRADRTEVVLLPRGPSPGRWITHQVGGQVTDGGTRVRRHAALEHLTATPALVTDPGLLRQLSARSALLAPLGSEDERVGALLMVLDAGRTLGARRGAFAGDDLDLVLPLAAAGSIALAQHQLLAHVRQEAEAREHEALHDGLTGLPNRRRLVHRVESALAAGPVGLLVLGLDRFQDVNDTLGHDVADLVLLKVAMRLGRHLAGSGAVLARLPGDEFAVVLPGRCDEELAREVTILLAAFDTPFAVAGTQLLVRATVGVASSSSTSSAARLVQFAESAMYAAKRGGLEVAVHQAGATEASRRRLALVRELRKALEQGDLTLVFQPQVELATGRPCGAEALLRWTSEEEGPVSPEEFVALAEQSGMGPQLNRYVLDRALDTAAGWAREGVDLVMAVNVSPRGLADGSLVADVPELLRRHGLPASRLLLEITEGSVMRDPAGSVRALQRLADLGVGLSIDDFGTGYSSLAYLKRLPVDEVKIDRSFVMDLSCDHDDLVIVAATVRLAHDLGLQVVAEGVEHAVAYAALRRLGCDRAQGYLLSRPLPLDDFGRWLRAWPDRAAEVLRPDGRGDDHTGGRPDHLPGAGARLA
jgi:diguanylate cyclase (GGDEF)-like protein